MNSIQPRVVIFRLWNSATVVVGEFVVYEGATDCQAHLCECLLALTVSHAFLKMSFVDGNTSCQLSEPVVFSFVQLSNILFLRPYHGKHSNLPSLLKRPNIHGIILEVNLRASAILLLVLQLAIIQLIPLM